MVHRFAVCALVASALLTGCGGASTTATHPRRLVLQPGPNALAHLHLTLRKTAAASHAPTKAEIRAATARFRAFVNQHCPCEVEETAKGGIRLLTDKHP
jgi:hypothetical protein